jgi:glycosyltransferase involved in cell wall biosynthesis
MNDSVFSLLFSRFKNNNYFQMPNVSVIVPNYNHAPYLHQRIESILNQTYQDYELILLDDCSTDNSRDIFLEYKYHPKVSHVIFNEVNSGSTFKQWHKGIELAKGKYIWLAESDDWADSSFLESLVVGFELTPNVILVFCQSFYIDKNGNIIRKTISSDKIIVKNGTSFIRHRLTSENAIYNASMCLFKKSVYMEVSREQYEKMKYCGDWFLWSLLSEQGDVVELKKQLNYYRKHDNNVSGLADQNGLSIFEGFNIFLYNRKYGTSKIQYLITLIEWAKKWIWLQPYAKNINTKILLYFLHNSPLIVIIYLVIYFPFKIKRIISSYLNS